jgi:anti-sigma factor RsiW
MSNQDLTPDCGRIRNELSAYLYGELAGEGKTALEQHLAGCAPCRDELLALRETQKLLERWETPRAAEDPRQLARSVAELARAEGRPAPRAVRGRLVRWSAILSGAAAALVFTLSVFATEATLADGSFHISFRLPGARPSANLPDLDEERVRAISAQEVSLQMASLKQDQQELLQRYSQMTREEMQQELLRLSQALDVALAQRERTWDTRLTHFGQEAARADREQRRVITDLAALVVPASNTNR